MLLLIPGPVSTHPAVRAAAARDYAPWDLEFRALVARVRHRVLLLAGGVPGEHAALPLQGCGHFAIEACVRTLVPPGARLLVPATGHYADRFARLAREAGREAVLLPVPGNERADPARLEDALRADPAAGVVGLVHSETSSGVVHDVPALAAAAGRQGRRVIVDAVSAMGALPFSLAERPEVDAVAFTANKCLEGLPGLAFVVARAERLAEGRGRAGGWSLDLADIHDHAGRAGPGTFRFTPPAGVLAALDVALDRLDAEGGPPARLRRYEANRRALDEGVRALGLRPYLPPAVQGPIVFNVHAPAHPAWDLQAFVDALKRRGALISNFHDTPLPSFRVGLIGAVSPDDLRRAAAAMGEALAELGVRTRAAA